MPHEIGFENHVVTAYSGGVPYVLVPVAGLDVARRANLDTRAWMELTGPAEALSPAAFVYCRETVAHGNAFHARMFAGHLGTPEDPATGSAVASFAGAIMRFDQPGDGVSRYPIEQGVEMGRPSLIRLELDVKERRARRRPHRRPRGEGERRDAAGLTVRRLHGFRRLAIRSRRS